MPKRYSKKILFYALCLLGSLIILAACAAKMMAQESLTATPDGPATSEPKLWGTAHETPVLVEPVGKPVETTLSLATATPAPAPMPAQISALDETWHQYTNQRLGFSINFPKTTVSLHGSCTRTEVNGVQSFRPEPSYVPVKIFEDGDTTYIAGEYYYELTGKTQNTSADGTTRTFFSECRLVTNSLELLRNPDNYYQTRWEIVAQKVHDDDELDAFLKSRYGSGCSLGEKMSSDQDGVYDILIQGDGKDPSETLCLLNYITVVKYYPQGNKVIAWDLGQAPTFVADPAYTETYDREMVDSFRFLTE